MFFLLYSFYFKDKILLSSFFSLPLPLVFFFVFIIHFCFIHESSLSLTQILSLKFPFFFCTSWSRSAIFCRSGDLLVWRGLRPGRPVLWPPARQWLLKGGPIPLLLCLTLVYFPPPSANLLLFFFLDIKKEPNYFLTNQISHYHISTDLFTRASSLLPLFLLYVFCFCFCCCCSSSSWSSTHKREAPGEVAWRHQQTLEPLSKHH